MTPRYLIGGVFGIQAFCAVFFVYDILGPFIGLRSDPIPWQVREAIEIGAALGLILGLLMGGLMTRRAFHGRREAEERLRRASGAFLDLLQERFAEWELTPAESDVALFAIKGMTTGEIASLRKTSEGTVKAQTNAIYRKAGVNGRSQLLSVFIEDLMRDDGAIRAAVSTGNGEAQSAPVPPSSSAA
ncbi:LuxR family transcriptional regulator [Aliigemmobacter aestuarii]|uniref:LuxR family transcriptional regulator n=1 Tax=Aliigemmobacter aestuarii TaxID=1445661 RepID=A0A4S3MRV3_9RHOB|nr:helix-turn-helix transcriptional regulator [Gemmobacter aestuarii]THD84823.1 LuxR family transcriptional regulator [Gemmobacter aestuarii]